MIIVIKNKPATWNQEMQHLREVIIVQSCSWIVVRLYDDNENNDDKDANNHKPIDNKVAHTTPTAMPKLTTRNETS